MTTDELRIALAEKLGWTDISLACDEADTNAVNPVGLRNGKGCLHQRLPSLSELVRQAEVGLSDEQQREYAAAIFQRLARAGVEVAHTGSLLLFRCITASDETRAAALIEVMKASGVAAPAIRGHEDNSSTQNPG